MIRTISVEALFAAAKIVPVVGEERGEV